MLLIFVIKYSKKSTYFFVFKIFFCTDNFYSKLVFPTNYFRFYIDINGQVRLFKNFNLVQDENTFYNVTILVTDSGGLSGFTSLMVYLNITSDIALKHSQFQCSYTGFRSDLDQTDLMTLKPKLFVLVSIIIRTLTIKNINKYKNFSILGEFNISVEVCFS